MNELKLFENNDFGKIRTTMINSKVHFVARDVAKALGYAKPENAIASHCKATLKQGILTNGGLQDMLVIPQGDVVRLAVKSKLPSAEKFESWVFDEVIPSVLNTGMYAVDELLDNPDLLIQTATRLKEEKNRRIIAENHVKLVEKEVKELKPKALFADAVSASETTILVNDLAKIIKQNGFDIGQKRLFEWLRENGYLIKRKGADWNSPTQRSMEMQLFEIKETTITRSDGRVKINKTTKVTGKGQQYFINKFLSKVS